jgi:hypothetical protein
MIKSSVCLIVVSTYQESQAILYITTLIDNLSVLHHFKLFIKSEFQFVFILYNIYHMLTNIIVYLRSCRSHLWNAHVLFFFLSGKGLHLV